MNAHEPPKDHVDDPGERAAEFGADDNDDNKANWQRLIFMLVMALIFGLGVTVATIVVVLQFFWVLFTGESKDELKSIGRQLGEYGKEIALYMTFNTEERPFPFDRDWPSDTDQ
ncbi:MAG: DUF4389 domain-containing protein [Gammaproteobacteria bacterium]|jgi:hypothetical protein